MNRLLVRNSLILMLAIVVQMTDATMAQCSPADLNNDCIVNMQDYVILANQWLKPQGTADIDRTDGVGPSDLVFFAEDWLVKKNDLIISEFLASNHDTLFDEDGDSSDWIEIYNSSQNTVSLDGWYLTDDRVNLTKWKVPAISLNAGDFLTVFASGKNRTNPDGNLHTNFKLSTDDTYLALVRDDGRTVAHFYDIDLDTRRLNVSYGINQQSQPITTVTQGAQGRLIVPTAQDNAHIGSTWTGSIDHEPFDDASWNSVTVGAGYDTRNSSSDNIALGKPATQSSEWGGYPASMGTDDILSNFTHTATGDLDPWWEIDLTQSYYINRIVMHNRQGCCPERLYNIFAEFYDADDFLIYESQVLNPVNEGSTPTNPGESLTLDLSSLPGGGVIAKKVRIRKNVINGGNGQEYLTLAEVRIFGSQTYTDIIETDIESLMKDVNASCYIRLPFDIGDPDAYDKIVLRMKYDDGFIAYLNGSEIASANAPAAPVGYDSGASDVHLVTDFNEYSVPLSLLRKGQNILAIQGLNYTPDDMAFLISPELIVYDIDVSGSAYFTQPTPGAINGYGVVGFVADTTFDMDRGFYDTPFDVHIRSETPGATIVYTTDGSVPTMSNGTRVNSPDENTPPVAPVHIETTTPLRTAAFKPEYEPTNTDTQTYIFLDDVIASSVMNTSITQNAVYAPQMRDALTDLPTISMVTGETIDKTFPVGASLEWITSDDSPEFQQDAGIRYFGGEWAGPFAKQNFRLYFKSEFGDTKLRFPLFEGHEHGIDAVELFDQLELRAGSHDMNQRGFYMSNRFTDDTMLDMGNLNPHGQFVHLYWNGTYWGQYHLRERWNADMSAQYLGGQKEDYEAVNGNWNVGGWADPGVPYDGDGSAWDRVKSLRDDYEAIKPYLDVPHYIDYMLMFLFGNSEDEYRCVGPTAPGSGFKWLLNDADGFTRDAGNRTGMAQPGRANGDGPGSIFSMLLAEGHPDYKTLLADRVHKHFFNDGAMTPAKNTARLLERCDQVERAFIAESARWGYRTPASWAAARDSYVNNVLPYRTATVIDQYTAAGFYSQVAAPVFYVKGFYQHGGKVNTGAALTMKQNSGGGFINTALVEAGASVRVLIAMDNSLAMTWTQRNFVPGAGWTDGSTGTGVGYEASSGYENMIDTDVIAMRGVSTSVLCRIEFDYSYNPSMENLELQMKYDDGFVAYLNGTEIKRSNNVTYDTPGAALAGSHEASTVYEKFDISSSKGLLVDGTNVLAIHGINASFTSSDFIILPRLIAQVPNDGTADPVWYTLDGSDPRNPGGTRNAEALQYTAPIPLNHSVHVKSRTYVNNQWSALNEAVYVTGQIKENLRITEIMYNPSDPNEEFIELTNVGDQMINLNLTRFTKGVNFIFGPSNLAPEQYILVVSNEQRFRQRYPGFDGKIAGQYEGNLNNGGENIRTRDAADEIIQEFTYKDGWYDLTDGQGFSLTIIDPYSTDPTAWDSKSGWRTSAVPGGSPGWDDSGLVPEPGSIVINELLAHSHQNEPDWIELHNTTNSPIYIGGWFLSDSNADDPNRMKYRIADNTVIPAGGYLVFSEHDHFRNAGDPGCILPFAFSEGGDDAYLFSAGASGISGYVEERHFGPSATAVTFGIYEKSVLAGAGQDFVALSSQTPGSANAPVKVGPVVISEIMYNPPEGGIYDHDQYEYIELHNITAAPVILREYDVINKIYVSWAITNGIDYTFPPDTTIPANGYLVIAKNLVAFQERYGAFSGVEILGPYDEQLRNGGERVQLSMPGDEEDDVRYYIRVDDVDYDDDDPWPIQPDGDGQSLQRQNLNAYGNDVINWQGADPSIGN